MPKPENGLSDFRKGHTTNKESTNTDLDKNNEDGSNSSERRTLRIPSDEFTNAIKTYMNDLYVQRTHHEHPRLKREQLIKVHDTIKDFAMENGLDGNSIVDMMISFLNNKSIVSDWNINHFATEGIMQNRYWEVAY